MNSADEIDGQHLGAEWIGELGTVPYAIAIGQAELAVAIDRRGPHQIAGGLDQGRIGLSAFG